METQGIAVFDVCGTVTKTNNTSDFIEFVLRKNSLWRYSLFLLIRVLSRLSRVPLIRSRSGRDVWRDGQIALLRGYSCDRIGEMARLYVDGLFTKRLWNERVLEAMAQEKERGKTICLVSAAIAPPVVEIAGRLGIETFCCSELEVGDGCYTGRLRTDLLGRKESVLERIAAGADLQNSSVYSDNAEDARFMMNFGRRTLVLNGSQATQAVDAGAGPFDHLVNPPAPPRYKDVHSVNERTVKWIYIPSLYYLISRFHREGLFSLLFRDLVPATLASYLFTNLGAFSFVVMPLSFLMFYSIYEIGGLVNDLSVKREPPGKGRTSRIAPGVHIKIALFVVIRLALVGLLLASLSLGAYPTLLYAGALAFCLAVFFLHTLILSDRRVLTFLLLKICRSAIPLALLVSRLSLLTWVYLGAIFVILDAPARVYVYCRNRALVKGEISVRRLRCTTAAILCGLGAVVYLGAGSPYLVAIASYYVVLDCLGTLRGRPWLDRE